MIDLREDVLVKLAPCENTLALSTYNRNIGRHGRFLILRDALEEWFSSSRERPFYDADCGNYLNIHAERKMLRLNITWLSQCGERVCGYAQSFLLPEAVLEAALHAGNPVRHLVTPQPRQARIEFQHASASLREIQQIPAHRRALSKAMRDCFKWRGDHVRLYPDGGRDFYFTAQDGLCGGLILHESTLKTPCGNRPKLFYSIHT